MAKTIMYCPSCDKYENFWSQYCPLCSRRTIVASEWDKMNDYERDHWKSAYGEPRRVVTNPFDGDRQLEKDFNDFDAKVRAEREEALKPKVPEPEKPVYTPKCPTCGSPDIERISGVSKVASAAMWGLFSNKIRKTFHCNNCGYEW